jgi:hypothetical protein
MDTLQQHEVFEMEVLDKMNSAKLLDPLVFGGGSMLRLCHELNRYSVDLDFWFAKKIAQDRFFERIRRALEIDFEITDAQVKHYTLLLELRSPIYPKRLKIEIRRELKASDYQETIAFSRFSTSQVILKAHTLDQTMENKMDAFLSRGEIRDCFDIEFLLRRGVELHFKGQASFLAFQNKLDHLTERDFKVKLGSILERDLREYYVRDKFSYLKGKLAQLVLKP